MCWSDPIIGNFTLWVRTAQPGSFKIPSVRNFSAIWVRSASVGTTTRSLGQIADTRIAIIVSVFPVPVGITIVAGELETAQCA